MAKKKTKVAQIASSVFVILVHVIWRERNKLDFKVVNCLLTGS